MSFYVNIVNDNIEQIGTIKPLGNLRMIKSARASNVRDLGGWECDGGKVSYGKLFRGAECYSEDNDVFCNLLKINHELDLRYDNEINEYKSPLGNNVQYTHINGVAYRISNQNYSNIKEIVNCVINCIKNNEILYFHCVMGADRTGTLACILSAILGVNQSDIDKDYELTCFFSGVSSYEEGRYRNENDWISLINFFQNYSGDTFRDKVVNFLVEIGISIKEINTFRKLMIDGQPEDLTSDKAVIINNLKNVVSSNSNVSINKGSSYSATITAINDFELTNAEINIIMGDVDITSEVYNEGVISIENVTDDIIITINIG